MTVVKGSLSWLPCRSPRRSVASVRARAPGGQRKVRRWKMTGGATASGVNSFPVVKLSCLALVTRKQQPQDRKEEPEGVAQRDSEMAPKAERSEEGGQPLWALPAFQGVLRLLCAAAGFPETAPPKQLKPQRALDEWCGMEQSPLKECTRPRVRVLLSAPPLGRDF